jgi:hypothetical protein
MRATDENEALNDYEVSTDGEVDPNDNIHDDNDNHEDDNDDDHGDDDDDNDGDDGWDSDGVDEKEKDAQPHIPHPLSCLFLNVCGVKSKIMYPDFCQFISQYDLICLVETKLADTDTVDLPGYTAFYKNREKYKHKSGGILMLIKDCYVKCVTVFEEKVFQPNIINNDNSVYYNFVNVELCRNALFFKVSEQLVGQDILFCATYLEPEGSPYFNRNAFVELENSIAQLGCENVCLLGDMNARTGNLDERMPDNAFVDELIIDNEHVFVLPRISQDNGTNTMGHELLNFCRTCNVTIVNGRVGTDAGIGKLTCKNASVVDYAIVSQELLYTVEDFAVLDFDDLLSDVHCPIAIKFSVNTWQPLSDENTDIDNVPNFSNINVKWNKDEKDTFVEHLDDNSIDDLQHNLDALLERADTVVKNDIDLVVKNVNDIFLASATTAGMVKNKKKMLGKQKEHKQSHGLTLIVD